MEHVITDAQSIRTHLPDDAQQSAIPHEKQLALLCLGLDRGMMHVCLETENDPVFMANYQAWISRLLKELEDNEVPPIVIIPTEAGDITLEQQDDMLVVRFGTLEENLAGSSFKSVLKGLYFDIMERFNFYSVAIQRYAIQQLLARPDDIPAYTKKAARLAIDFDETCPEQCGDAAQFMLKNASTCDERYLIKAAQIKMSHVTCPGNLSNSERARHVVQHSKNYGEEYIQAAVTYIIFPHNSTHFSYSLIQQATDCCIQHFHSYPTVTLTHFAATFIQHHLSFFQRPLNHQKSFIQFYLDSGEFDVIQHYSDGLESCLRAHKEPVARKIEDPVTNSISIKKFSLYRLWRMGFFWDVLSISREVCIYILQNREHKAIQYWEDEGNSI